VAGEYVQFYSLARSEGVLLRYLSDTYKALLHTVPPERLREDLEDIIEWLGELVRQTDSSLLDEWEELTSGINPDASAEPVLPPVPDRLTSNVRAFRVMVRNEMFQRVKLFADEDDHALGELDGDAGWDADRWAEVLDAYFEEHEDIDDGPDGRGPNLLIIKELPGKWEVRQIFKDPANHLDWGINAEVDLAASDDAGAPVIKVIHAGRLD
jgi:hypothetical protein